MSKGIPITLKLRTGDDEFITHLTNATATVRTTGYMSLEMIVEGDLHPDVLETLLGEYLASRLPTKWPEDDEFSLTPRAPTVSPDEQMIEWIHTLTDLVDDDDPDPRTLRSHQALRLIRETIEGWNAVNGKKNQS